MATIPASENIFPLVELAEGAAPSTPPSGNVRLYAKSDGLPYSKDDAGTESALGAGAHVADTSDAHDASAISVDPTGLSIITGTDGQTAFEELDAAVGAGGISPTIVDVKGDIIAATAADTVARLAAGANGSALLADSGQSTGLRWQAPTSADATLGGDVTIVNASTFYDGPSASLVAGTWLVLAQMTVKVIVTTSQTYAWNAKLWDGTNIFAEGFVGVPTNANHQNWAHHLPTMMALVTLGSTQTVKVSVQSNRGSSASAIARDETPIFSNSSHTASHLAWRLY